MGLVGIIYDIIGIGVVILIVILFLYNLFFYFFFEKILFQGHPLESNHKFDFEENFEEITLKPDPVTRLHGLLFKASKSKGLILYFHGNRGELTRWGRIGQKLLAYHYDVLIVDYRGYGKSRGKRTEKLIYEDAVRFYDHARDVLGYANIVVYGRSLGSAVATYLATQRRPKQLILETPMTQIKDIIKCCSFLLLREHWLTFKMNSLGRIKAVDCPINIIHGTSDRVVPYRLGMKLFNAIERKDKKIFTIVSGKHNNLNNFVAYQQAMDRILDLTN